MEMESMVAVLKFTSCSGSSSEEEDDREICDDPTATLVIPSPSPTACEREETDSGICGECLRHVELPGWGWGWRGREGICGLSYSHVIARHTVAMTSCFILGTCEVHRITWLCTCLLFIILSVWYQITWCKPILWGWARASCNFWSWFLQSRTHLANSSYTSSTNLGESLWIGLLMSLI